MICDDSTNWLRASTTKVSLPRTPLTLMAVRLVGVVRSLIVNVSSPLLPSRLSVSFARELERLEVVDRDQPGRITVVRRGRVPAVGALLVVDNVVRGGAEVRRADRARCHRLAPGSGRRPAEWQPPRQSRRSLDRGWS